MKIRQNKMMGYLAVTAGVGCASSAANAAVVFYGNANNTNIQADPNGLLFQQNIRPEMFGGGTFLQVGSINQINTVYFGRNFVEAFTRGSDLATTEAVGRQLVYHSTLNPGGFSQNAIQGDQNYANISFNGNDSVYEAVAQFYFDGSRGGYLMAIATINDIPNPQDLSAVGGLGLSISAGKDMIDAAAAIPEPSSLALLALGATGLIARRRRQQAA
jgi:hypothetical protein